MKSKHTPFLLKKWVNMRDKRKMTPLAHACASSCISANLIKMLLEYGANPNKLVGKKELAFFKLCNRDMASRLPEIKAKFEKELKNSLTVLLKVSTCYTSTLFSNSIKDCEKALKVKPHPLLYALSDSEVAVKTGMWILEDMETPFVKPDREYVPISCFCDLYHIRIHRSFSECKKMYVARSLLTYNLTKDLFLEQQSTYCHQTHDRERLVS